MNLYAYDQKIPVRCLCGVDEAGRGPLAGPVFASAVILPLDDEIEGINDSKKIAEKKRERIFEEIISKAKAYSIASASVEEIDELNILQATFLAMRRAVQGLQIQPDCVLIDGNLNTDVGVYSQCVIKGDGLSANIAAASILSKVSRDRYMRKLAVQYPQYHLEKHKGYGTQLHRELLLKHGASPVHRKTFLRKIFNIQDTEAQKRGKLGEKVSRYYLRKQGYTILRKNYHSMYGEIDIIAEKEGIVAFVEVKTRSEQDVVKPREAVTKNKQRKIIQTALQFIQEVEDKQPRFDVVEVWITKDEKFTIRHIQNAFTTEGFDAFI